MWWATGTDSRHVDLAWIGLGVGDELRNGLGRERWINLHYIDCAHGARDRCDVANEIEIEFVEERRVDCVRQADLEERIAVRRRSHDQFGADIALGPRPVVDDELLAEPIR